MPTKVMASTSRAQTTQTNSAKPTTRRPAPATTKATAAINDTVKPPSTASALRAARGTASPSVKSATSNGTSVAAAASACASSSASSSRVMSSSKSSISSAGTNPTSKAASASSSTTRTSTFITEAWTETNILKALAAPKDFPTHLPQFVLLLLGVTREDLSVDLEESFRFDPVDKLAPAKAVYFAKQIVNAGLSCIGQLVASAWTTSSSLKPVSLQTAAPTPSRTGSIASTSSVKKSEASSTISEVHAIQAAIDTFRLACRFLLHNVRTSSKPACVNGKELEVETIILRTSSKIKALGFDTLAHQDVCYLGSSIIDRSPNSAASAILHIPHRREDELMWSVAYRGFLVELQSMTVIRQLECASTADLKVVLTELQHELGPLEWQTRERGHLSDFRTLDRVAYSIERSISKALQRLGTPNDLANLHNRAIALYFLVQVSDIDMDAFWERAARIGGSCLKVEQSQGRDILEAFLQVQDVFEELTIRAALIDATKTKGSGFIKFCEMWVNYAKKVNNAAGIDRATAAMDGLIPRASRAVLKAEAVSDSVSLDKQTFIRDPQKQWTDQEMTKLTASLTSAVLALDQIIANKVDSKTQQIIEQGTRLINSITSWPASLSRASQYKLHKVIDRISRRSWTKLSSQGVNSKGQSKCEDTSSICIDRIAQACLSLLDSLYSLGEPHKAESVSETLPDLESQLTDLIYGRRILANKLFSPETKSNRDQTLAELKRCQELLASELTTAAVPPSVLSEQLRLLSSSFYNPAGVLYNNSNYEEAAIFLQRAAECDFQSVRILAQVAADTPENANAACTTQDLEKRQEGVTKKLEFVAVALRLSGQKDSALVAYKSVFASLSDSVQRRLSEASHRTGIDEVFAKPDNKGIASLIKSIVDLSVFDLSMDLDADGGLQSFTSWLALDTRLDTASKGAMLEHAAVLLESRSHLHGASKAIGNVHRALLTVYGAEEYPLRRARILIKQLELEVLSQRLTLRQEDIENLEAEALRCLANDLACDAGLERYQSQYKCSLLLILALAERLRQPFEDPTAVVEKVEHACNAIAASWKTPGGHSQKATSPLTQGTTISRRRQADKTTVAATPTTRRTLSRRGAPPQPTAANNPVTPPARSSKPDFAALSTITKSPRPSTEHDFASKFDRVDHFCRLLEIVQDAFSTLALTRCSVELLKVLRNVAKHAMSSDSGCEVFCRSSTDLAQAYLALGKVSRAASILHQASSCWMRTGNAVEDPAVTISQDARFRCLMVGAEIKSQDGDIEGAERKFEEALKLAKVTVKGGRDIQSSLAKLKTRERQAISYGVCASLQLARGNLAGAIESTTMAVRQLIRQSGALASISRKVQECEMENDAPNSDAHPTSEHSDINASEELERVKDAEDQRLPAFSSTVFSSFFWRSSKNLMVSYLRLSQLHGIRGAGLDAEVYAGECIDFATSMRFALPLAQGLIHRGEIRLQLVRTDLGQEDLSRCLEVLQETWIPEVITLACVQGDCLTRIEQLGEALRSYTSGEATLQTLSATFGELENILASPLRSQFRQRPSLNQTPKSRPSLSSDDFVLPELRSKLLRRQAWIWQLMGQSEQGEMTINKALSVQDGLRSVEARVDQYVLEGRIALRRALEHLKGDHFFSMLPEAAISIPMVPSSSMRALASASYANQSISEDTVRAALNMLTPADAAFKAALSFGALSSHSLLVREAFASLAQVYTTQASLGKSIKTAANKAATLIDRASSVGVRRNLLVAIANKRKDKIELDAHEWPTLHDAASSSNNKAGDLEDEDGDLPNRLAKLQIKNLSKPDAESRKEHPVSAYWQSVQLRHEQAHLDLDSGKVLLPRNWTVISISSMGRGSESLVLTRQEGGGGEDGCRAKEATVYNLPLHRRSQREGGDSDEDEQLTLKAAQEKLVEIVRSSNDGIHGVRDVQGLEARRQWWTARHQLDDELRELLQAIQDTWLGGFKGVFAETSTDDQAKAALRSRFEKIIRRACFPTANKRPNKLKLDDAVFECFAGLPAECTDEDLEDLVHYVMDALQFSGMQVAVDEVDLDETAMDLRAALDEHRGKRIQAVPSKGALPYLGLQDDGDMGDQHLFLVLDNETSVFPWESMPILRGKAVSRIPSMAFLQDRIQLAKIYHCLPGVEMDEPSSLQKGKMKSSARSPSKPRAVREVDPEAAWKIALRNGKLFSLSKRKTFYMLNPGGDLIQSQERFEPWLKSRSSTSSWKGIVGRQPIVNEMPDALTESDLFLYFGHGGAEQFVRATRVRELSRCAVAMLWGCSSAVLQDNGEFDRTGTPLNYMCAGSPAMVGNLWDMTDRELDSVCEGVFSRVGLMHSSERAEVRKAARNLATDSNGQLRASRGCKAMSLVRAIGESRDDCKLPYLTGAAAVVYGVPVYWADDDDSDTI